MWTNREDKGEEKVNLQIPQSSQLQGDSFLNFSNFNFLNKYFSWLPHFSPTPFLFFIRRQK